MVEKLGRFFKLVFGERLQTRSLARYRKLNREWYLLVRSMTAIFER